MTPETHYACWWFICSPHGPYAVSPALAAERVCGGGLILLGDYETAKAVVDGMGEGEGVDTLTDSRSTPRGEGEKTLFEGVEVAA